MPTKHIQDDIWRDVEKTLVKAVVETKSPIRDTALLNLLVEIGIQNVKTEDYQKLIKKK